MRTWLMLVTWSCIAAITQVGCADKSPEDQQVPDGEVQLTERVAMLMGGWPHANAITTTGTATAFRITQDREDNFKEKIISEGIELSPKQREALVALLARDDAYAWDVAKGCEPMPGVLITFEDGATYARVRICFGCQMIGFTPGDWEDFDPINDELIAWAKGVFPDDQAIQSLGTEDELGGL
ncbi:MAG: hypothetical protein ACE37H_17855 [Phycisphaeraceae bacterium]